MFLFSKILTIYFISCSNNSETPSSPKNTTQPTPTNTFIPGTTPTNTLNPTSTPNPTTDNVSGILYLPTPQPGKQFFVAADNDLDILNGSKVKMWGICGMSSYISYSFTVPAGNYFIMAGVDISNTGFVYGPINGDLFGVYGGASPSLLNVTSGQQSYANIYLTAVPTFTATFTFTPTVTPTTTSIIIGNIIDNSINASYQIWLDNNLNPYDGFVELKLSVIESSPQSFTFSSVYPGSYYIYAWVDSGSNQFSISPFYINQYDKIGWYGENYPTAPSAPNIIVSSGSIIQNINIQMKQITTENYNVTITYPSLPLGQSKQAACILDNSNNFNDGVVYIKTQTVSGNQANFNIYIPFSGTYYIYAFVDVDNSGITSGPGYNDYKGYMGPFNLNAGIGGNIQINLN